MLIYAQGMIVIMLRTCLGNDLLRTSLDTSLLTKVKFCLLRVCLVKSSSDHDRYNAWDMLRQSFAH